MTIGGWILFLLGAFLIGGPGLVFVDGADTVSGKALANLSGSCSRKCLAAPATSPIQTGNRQNNSPSGLFRPFRIC